MTSAAFETEIEDTADALILVGRERILHSFTSIPPAGFHCCESCRRELPKGAVKARYTVPIETFQTKHVGQLLRICKECHVAALERWEAAQIVIPKSAATLIRSPLPFVNRSRALVGTFR